MWGNPDHLAEMARQIRRKVSDVKRSLSGEFRVLVANTNIENYTYDGVDHGGERVAEEVRFPTLDSLIPCGRSNRSILPLFVRFLRK